MAEPPPALAARIRRLRQVRGYTQATLADAVGTTVVSVHHWEHGICLPQVPLFAALARALEVDMDTLFWGEADG